MPSSYLSARLRARGVAVRGLKELLQTQPNARHPAPATVLAVVAGALLGISPAEWALIALAVVCVWATEALNTSIESLVDLVSPELHPLAAKAKDVAAGAGVGAAIGAGGAGGAGVGAFAPKVFEC